MYVFNIVTSLNSDRAVHAVTRTNYLSASAVMQLGLFFFSELVVNVWDRFFVIDFSSVILLFKCSPRVTQIFSGFHTGSV